MPRKRDSDGDTSDSSARRFRESVTVNSPLRRSSRIIVKQKELSPKLLRSRSVRASSESKSPLPKKVVRRTRANSVDRDDDYDSPVKTRGKLSVAPQKSPVKEEIEDTDTETTMNDISVAKRRSYYRKGNKEVNDDIKEKSAYKWSLRPKRIRKVNTITEKSRKKRPRTDDVLCEKYNITKRVKVIVPKIDIKIEPESGIEDNVIDVKPGSECIQGLEAESNDSTLFFTNATCFKNVKVLNISDSCTVTGSEDSTKTMEKTTESSSNLRRSTDGIEQDKRCSLNPNSVFDKSDSLSPASTVSMDVPLHRGSPHKKEEDKQSETDLLNLQLELADEDPASTELNEPVNVEKSPVLTQTVKTNRRKSVTFASNDSSSGKLIDCTESDDDFQKRINNFFKNRDQVNKESVENDDEQQLSVPKRRSVEPMEIDRDFEGTSDAKEDEKKESAKTAVQEDRNGLKEPDNNTNKVDKETTSVIVPELNVSDNQVQESSETAEDNLQCIGDKEENIKNDNSVTNDISNSSQKTIISSKDKQPVIMSGSSETDIDKNKIDPVKKFIKFTIPKEKLNILDKTIALESDNEETEAEEVINESTKSETYDKTQEVENKLESEINDEIINESPVKNLSSNLVTDLNQKTLNTENSNCELLKSTIKDKSISLKENEVHNEDNALVEEEQNAIEEQTSLNELEQRKSSSNKSSVTDDSKEMVTDKDNTVTELISTDNSKTKVETINVNEVPQVKSRENVTQTLEPQTKKHQSPSNSEPNSEEESSTDNNTYTEFISAIKSSKPVLVESDDQSVSIDEEDLDESSLDEQEEVQELEESIKNLFETKKVKKNDEADVSTVIPKFMYSITSESSEDGKEGWGEIHSDVLKEYNLDGETICEYDDDDVSADDIRVSETESSENSEDSMRDFIVDHEEDEEECDEEVEEEDENEDDNKAQVEEMEVDEVKEAEVEVNVNKRVRTSLDNSSRKSDSSKSAINSSKRSMNRFIVMEEEADVEGNDQEESPDISEMSLIRNLKADLTKTSSTPNIEFTKKSRRSKCSVDIDAFNNTLPIETVENTFESKKGRRKSDVRKSLHRSLPITETTTPVDRPRKVKSLLSKTMYPEESETPMTKHLKKIRINDTEPVIKLPEDTEETQNSSSKNKNKNISLKKNVVTPVKQNIAKSLEEENNSVTEVSIEVEANVEKKSTKKKNKNKKEKIEEKQVTEPTQEHLEEEKLKKKRKNKKKSEEVENKLVKDPTLKSTIKAKTKKSKIEEEVSKDQEMQDKKMLQKKQQKVELEEQKAVNNTEKTKKRKKEKAVNEEQSSNGVEATTIFQETAQKTKIKKDKQEAASKVNDELQIVDEKLKKSKKKKELKVAEPLVDVQRHIDNSEKPAKKMRKMDATSKTLKRCLDEISTSFTEDQIPIKKRRKVDSNSPSTSGSTTYFEVTTVSKKKKVPTTIQNFRQVMLSRNSLQSMSAYQIYLQKLKAAGKHRH